MKYSNESYKKAREAVKLRKEQAEDRVNVLENMLMDKNREFYDISLRLSKRSSVIAKAVLSGGNVKQKIAEIKEETGRLYQRRIEILESCGYSEDDLKPKYYCTKCNDTGEIDNTFCDCFKALLKKYAYDELNNATPLKLSGFDDFSLDYYSNTDIINGKSERCRMEEIYSFCKEYAETFDKNSQNLLLMGGTGLGKTHLSLAIAGRVISRGFGVVYGSAQNLFSQIEKEHFGKSQQECTDEKLLSCDLLVIDDFGTEFLSAFVASSLYNIINTRILKSLPTVISTNLTISEIRSSYHERIASRLMGNYEPLRFVGADIRQKKFTEDR